MRRQTGQLILASGSIYIRFYRNGKRVAEKLCEVDDVHYGLKAKAVKNLQAEFMLKVNSPVEPPSSLTVPEFYRQWYVPYIEDTLKPSSIHGYKKLWEGTLAGHFEGKTLAGYKTVHGSEFLTSLRTRLSRVSLQHVRGLCSSIFSLAVNKGMVERNIWREVKILGRQKDSEPTGHYTLDEALEIIGLLSGREKVAFGLAFYLALRPGELRSLKWEDFNGDSVLIRRSAWRGHVGTTKMGTEQKIPLIGPAKELLEEWRSICGGPTEGWLFASAHNHPLEIAALTRPMKKALGDRFKGLYSCRRGMSTILTETTGNPLSAQGLLRHRSFRTTLGFYTKSMPVETARGMALVEDAVKSKG